MLKKIKELLKSLSTSNYYNNCYTSMENNGYAAMNCCSGITGCDKEFEYLSEGCISCPYLVLGANKKSEE